jgi:hypothetical protein
MDLTDIVCSITYATFSHTMAVIFCPMALQGSASCETSRAAPGGCLKMWHCGLALAVGIAVAGCEEPRGVAIVASPYADGIEHIEPVVYNGKSYDVGFRFSAAGNMYEVTVAGKGRRLGGTAGDQKIVEQVAISAVRHFACPTGQRGEVVAGSTRHGGSAWGMQVRCT